MSKDIFRKPRIEPSELKTILEVALPTMNIEIKFQLNPLSCSRDIVVTMRRFFMIVDSRAFRKSSIKISGSIFFSAVCAKLHQRVASITSAKINEIEDARSSTASRGLYAMALMRTPVQ